MSEQRWYTSTAYDIMRERAEKAEGLLRICSESKAVWIKAFDEMRDRAEKAENANNGLINDVMNARREREQQRERADKKQRQLRMAEARVAELEGLTKNSRIIKREECPRCGNDLAFSSDSDGWEWSNCSHCAYQSLPARRQDRADQPEGETIRARAGDPDLD